MIKKYKWTIIISCLFLFIISFGILRVSFTIGTSMEDTLKNNSITIVTKIIFDIERNDIVINRIKTKYT